MRKLKTGRFGTREELVDCVLYMWDANRTKADIARNVRVSESLVANIIKGRKR